MEFLPSSWIHLLDSEADLLASPFLEEEVNRALFDLKPFKAPRADGLYMGFYQNCLSVVGDSFTNKVLDILHTIVISGDLNKTLVALIPNCNGPESISQFKPISLYNTIYKTVKQVIVDRLSQVLPSIISPL